MCQERKLIVRAVTIDRSLDFVEPMLSYLKQKYDVHLLSSPGDNIDEICANYQIAGHRVEMARRISLFKDIKSLFEIIQLFRKLNPYMVHSMTPKAGLLCMIAAWITRVPKRIHTFTGLVWPTSIGIKRIVLIITDWLTCACATHIIPEGQGVLNDLRQSITKKPMRVLGFGNIKGVDLQMCSRRPEVMVKAAEIQNVDTFTFIFVGRLVGDKGINELVTSFGTLNEKYPDTRLLLVGRYEDNLDPLKSDTLETIKSNPSIEAVGPKYSDELLAYYAASDCFVFPSYREGFPNTVLEAGAMELPSIVTDINGSREIICDGENGLIVPPKDVNALYNAMEQILINYDLRCSMANNARPMIEARFEQGFVQRCLFEYYDEVL